MTRGWVMNEIRCIRPSHLGQEKTSTPKTLSSSCEYKEATQEIFNAEG